MEQARQPIPLKHWPNYLCPIDNKPVVYSESLDADGFARSAVCECGHTVRVTLHHNPTDNTITASMF